MNSSALKNNHHHQLQIKITRQLELILRLNPKMMAVLVDTVTNKMFLHPNATTPVNMQLQEPTKQSQGQSFQLSEKIEKYTN